MLSAKKINAAKQLQNKKNLMHKGKKSAKKTESTKKTKQWQVQKKTEVGKYTNSKRKFRDSHESSVNLHMYRVPPTNVQMFRATNQQRFSGR